MNIAVAILMKDPAEAKTRLAEALEFDAREKLALTLFEHTLAFVTNRYGHQAVGVVTPSPRIAAIAEDNGASAIHDDGSRGINGAAALAARWANERAAGRLLIVHADIPALSAEEFLKLEDAAEVHEVVIAASTDGGTNAIVVTLPDEIPFGFGRGSANAHQEAARKLGKTNVTLTLPHLSRDIDRPADLAAHPHLLSKPNPETASRQMFAFSVTGLPEVKEGDNLAAIVADALDRQGDALKTDDIVVLAQKIVSKSEGRMVELARYAPSKRASEIAEKTGKDPRKVEAILQESSDVLRLRDESHGGLIVTRHRHGWVCANAGIDESNLGSNHSGHILLLPEDPDASAHRIRSALEARFGISPGVIISDTFGRPWRNGLVNVAIGVAGVPVVIDWTGRDDAYGRQLAATNAAFADEVAAAAGLQMGKDAGTPVVVVRGLSWKAKPDASAKDVLRPVTQELFL